MKKTISVIIALGFVAVLNAGITSGWRTRKLTIDPELKTWELHAQGYVGSVKLDRTYKLTSAELIPKLTNDAAVVQSVFDEIVAVLTSNAIAEAEAELAQ